MSQIHCSISGEVLYKSDLLLGFDLQDLHPIFRAKPQLILKTDTIHRFQKSQNWAEKKLLFLAVLHTMNLVQWKSPAKPMPDTIEANFLEAMQLAGWVDYARHGIKDRIQFPEYICSKELNTQELANIPVWLRRISEIKQTFLNRDREDDRKREINESSQKIEVEFKRASLTGAAFTLPLARWALELADCPEGIYRRWLELLQTPLSEAWCFGSEDVAELQDILELFREELPAHNDQCIAVVHQVKQLIAATKWGFKPGEEPGDDELDEQIGPRPVQPKRPNTPRYQIVSDMEIANPENYEIPPEPRRLDFNEQWKYLAAKARWDLLKQELTNPNKSQYKQF